MMLRRYRSTESCLNSTGKQNVGFNGQPCRLGPLYKICFVPRGHRHLVSRPPSHSLKIALQSAWEWPSLEGLDHVIGPCSKIFYQ
jgi:hypothetical protein